MSSQLTITAAVIFFILLRLLTIPTLSYNKTSVFADFVDVEEDALASLNSLNYQLYGNRPVS